MDEKTTLSKPTMLYDGDCGFCQHWIERWKHKTHGAIDYAPYQEALRNFPQVSERGCKEAVQLIIQDGSVTSGAHAIFKALEVGGSSRLPHFLYERLPFFGRIAEVGYQWVAHHRLLLSKFIGGPIKKCV